MSKRLVTYFSASGVTAKVAENLADAIGADIFEIQLKVSYTKADLNWMDKKVRSTIEMSDPASRPAIAAKRDNIAEYDTIFVGYSSVKYAISEISSSAISFEDFQRQLFDQYKIRVKESRGRYGYLHPEREKYISGRSLGTNFDKDYLLNLFEANALAAEQEEKQRQTMPDYHADPIAILFIRSDLRLVVDLQNCIKAQQSRAYAQKVKISNLQQMAKTVAYIQENGFDTRENLQTTYDSITLQMHDARQKTKDTETQIKSVNEQIHYLGQYLSTKSTYNEFLKARFKGKFRKDHADEIEKHEKAAQILKAQNPDGSLPKMKDLKLEKERLLALKAAQYDTYTYYKDYQKELRTACANVDSILGQHHIRDHIQRTEQTL